MRQAVRRVAPSGVPLLERARAGDDQAFEQIVREHQSMVFGLACRAIRDRAAAEELAQDVFVELFRSLERLESSAHLIHWLRRVTSHRCIDWCRRNRPRVETPADEAPELSVTPASRDILFEKRLWTLVGTLAPQPRMVLILRYQEDLDPSEIAGLLGMPVNTVKSHLRRSVALLRVALEGEARVLR